MLATYARAGGRDAALLIHSQEAGAGAIEALGRAARVDAARQDATVMGLVGLAHLVSHFSQLLLPPLFPWLKDAFAVSYAELGLLMTIFFVVSCAVQTAAGADQTAADVMTPRSRATSIARS